MSQKKVDYYKEQKANRKSIMKREKLLFRLEITAIVVVLVGLIAWFSVSVYQNASATADANKESEQVGIYTSAITDYLNYLDSATEEEVEEEEVEEAVEAEEEITAEEAEETSEESAEEETTEEEASGDEAKDEEASEE